MASSVSSDVAWGYSFQEVCLWITSHRSKNGISNISRDTSFFFRQASLEVLLLIDADVMGRGSGRWRQPVEGGMHNSTP